MRRILSLSIALLTAALFAGPQSAEARPLRRVAFLVVDPLTRRVAPLARVVIEDGHHLPVMLVASAASGTTPVFDLAGWRVAGASEAAEAALVTLAPDQPATFQAAPPVRDIYIKVTAYRVQLHPADTSAGTRIGQSQINTFVNKVGGDTRALTQGQPSVATDSAGQQHIRGEHADITYVIDGVPLPDTLAGRQESIVAPTTIESLDMLTGGFAPEFGGQTAAILDITTFPGARKSSEDLTLQEGEYNTMNGDLGASGPMGKRLSYVLDVIGNRTDNAVEPQQPDVQTAHNTGSNYGYFTKLRATPDKSDTVTLSLSHSPGWLQINNRSGLPASFANVGQGYGFLGLRDANGVRPDVTDANAGALGSATEALLSQQADGMDIDQAEVDEFALLSWRRQLNRRDSTLFSVIDLHSGQDVWNHNPGLDVLNLPVDNSIEFSPTVSRNVHHLQVTGTITLPRGQHQFKAGFLNDGQTGDESYQIVAYSRLALDDLAALAPSMAPAGSVQTDAAGNPVLDVDGNPVYVPTSRVTPTLSLHREGYYWAAYVQDTWKPSARFTVNYGLRADWFRQAENLGLPPVDTSALSPRVNFSYSPNRLTVLRWSYNRLFNTPPLAQGSVIGMPVTPERYHQYDVSLQRQVRPGQTLDLAYYYKQIRDQVDTGLLIPGSWLGLYQSVNFQYGAVHGIEFSYDFSPPKGVGWDGYLNYTYSIAAPNGVDNTGAPAPQYNDHDQRHTVGLGLAYLFKGGASAATTVSYGSGLDSSPIIPNGPRIPRTEVDLHLSTGPLLFHHRSGFGLDVTNLLDARTVINFQSGFSGTRFMQARRILASAFLKL